MYCIGYGLSTRVRSYVSILFDIRYRPCFSVCSRPKSSEFRLMALRHAIFFVCNIVMVAELANTQ